MNKIKKKLYTKRAKLLFEWGWNTKNMPKAQSLQYYYIFMFFFGTSYERKRGRNWVRKLCDDIKYKTTLYANGW